MLYAQAGAAPFLWRLRPFFFTLLLSAVLMTMSVMQSFAMRIETIVSPKGVEALLVEDHTIPLISMQIGFKAGSAQAPAGKEGLSHFISGTLDEGAGNLPGREFQQRLEELAVKLSFNDGFDHFTGSLQTLSANKDAAFDLLRMALTQPLFDGPDIERIRAQIIAGLKVDEEDPETIASQEWFKMAFGDHPYSRPQKGTPESVASITQDDLRAFVKAGFARRNLKIAVVGDITPDALKTALDRIFGDLPENSTLPAVPEAEFPAGAQTKVMEMPIPQSVAQFGLKGLKRKDPDFVPAYVLNYILGGGGFASTLMTEVREKRGLAYSVYSYLYPLDKAGLLIGGVATENKSLKQSLEVIVAELKKLALEGPPEEDLDNAKRYLTGSYPLNFDSGGKISAQLLNIQLQDLGTDYIARRNGLIEAVTMDDIKRVAAKLLLTNDLLVTVVGQPEGLSSSNGAPRG